MEYLKKKKKENDDYTPSELCDVCNRNGYELCRTIFPYKENINIVIRHHNYCDPNTRYSLIINSI